MSTHSGNSRPKLRSALWFDNPDKIIASVNQGYPLENPRG